MNLNTSLVNLNYEGSDVRSVIHDGEMYYSVIDVVKVLTDSPRPDTYWAKVKQREFTKNQTLPNWESLKLPAPDGKMRVTDCATRENILRIIQSIPSKKAEPFKMWLAKVGNEKLENAELAHNLVKTLDRKAIRKKGIEERKAATAQMKKTGGNYAQNTNNMYRGGYDKPASGLRKDLNISKGANVRDHLNAVQLLAITGAEMIGTINSQLNKYGNENINWFKSGETIKEFLGTFENALGTKIPLGEFDQLSASQQPKKLNQPKKK